MSIRKTKLIQQRNILIEQKYILEQTTTSPQVSGSTSPPQVVTTTTTNKITKDFYSTLALCSSVKSPENPEEIKTEFGIVLKDPKGKQPYCKKEDN